MVVAFSDSALVRETLTVLLEHDCDLRFLSPDAASLADSPLPDLALVATSGPGRLLHDLTRRWPTLPIVAVEMPQAPAQPEGAAAYPHVHSVPLEPHAIRTAVRQELALPPDAALRTTAERVATALRSELSYSFTALRSFPALPATGSATETAAIIGAVLREQSHVVDECVALLHRFQTRPRSLAMSAEFVAVVCRQLAERERLAAERGIRCECVIEARSPHVPGPVALAPVLAAFLRAHLRRRSDGPVVNVCGTARGLSIRYRVRQPAALQEDTWPLLLAALALQPWSWGVERATGTHEETVSLCPVT